MTRLAAWINCVHDGAHGMIVSWCGHQEARSGLYAMSSGGWFTIEVERALKVMPKNTRISG